MKDQDLIIRRPNYDEIRVDVLVRARELVTYAAKWLLRVPPEKRANGKLFDIDDGRVCYCALGAYGKNKLGFNRAKLRTSGTYERIFSPFPEEKGRCLTVAEAQLLGKVCVRVYHASDDGAHSVKQVRELQDEIDQDLREAALRIRVTV